MPVPTAPRHFLHVPAPARDRGAPAVLVEPVHTPADIAASMPAHGRVVVGYVGHASEQLLGQFLVKISQCLV